MGKSKKKISKIVGTISKKITEKYKLYEYEGQEIIQDLGLYSHIQKHIHEFESVDSYNETITHIEDIISDPLFVYYDPHKVSLLYFKKLYEHVCVVVQLNLKKNKDNYIATVYPVSENKIRKYIEKSYIINR